MKKIIECSLFNEEVKTEIIKAEPGNVETLTEWIKWLLYEPEFIKKIRRNIF